MTRTTRSSLTRPGWRTTTSIVALALASASVAARPGAAAAQAITLADVVASALETHPTLTAAEARAAGADHVAAAERATRLPTAAVEGSLTRFQEPMIVAPLHAFDPARPPIFDQTLVQGRLTAAYAAFDGGSRGARIRARDEEADATRAGARATRMELLAQVVTAYSAVVAARSVRDAANAQVAALDAELVRARQSFDAGGVARVEVLRATAARDEARADASSADMQVGLAERSLARLSGLDAARLRGATLTSIDLDRAPPGAMDATRPAVTPSPRTEQARRALAAAEAGLDEARAARLPGIDLTAALLDYGTATGAHRAEWQAGVRVRWPIFTGGARGARVQGARARVEADRATLAATELAVAQEVDVARTAALDAAARSEALASAVEQWAEVARIEELALAAGSGVQADRLRAEAGLFRATAALARARHDHITARVEEARALGSLDADWIERAMEAAR